MEWRGVVYGGSQGGPERRWPTTAPYGGGENTGKESSIDGIRGSSSDMGGDPKDIRCGSR